MINRLWAVMVMGAALACAGGDRAGHDDGPPEEPTPTEQVPTEVEACAPPPAGFVAWKSPDGLVNVSKKLSGTQSGVALQAQVQHVDTLPAVVDFGTELIEVRPDLTLCLR